MAKQRNEAAGLKSRNSVELEEEKKSGGGGRASAANAAAISVNQKPNLRKQEGLASSLENLNKKKLAEFRQHRSHVASMNAMQKQ